MAIYWGTLNETAKKTVLKRTHRAYSHVLETQWSSGYSAGLSRREWLGTGVQDPRLHVMRAECFAWVSQAPAWADRTCPMVKNSNLNKTSSTICGTQKDRSFYAIWSFLMSGDISRIRVK